jgi:hypothetical protein
MVQQQQRKMERKEKGLKIKLDKEQCVLIIGNR